MGDVIWTMVATGAVVLGILVGFKFGQCLSDRRYRNEAVERRLNATRET